MPCGADLAQLLIGKGLETVRRQIEFLARSQLPVLILGESGVGKELAAQGLALLSGRPMERFRQVNAAVLADPLAESLLFGHVRGAFTGAIESREGFFDAARGGVLFLDEIAEMSLAVQAKFLRILDGHPFTRLGETRPTPVDARLILATNAPLPDLARKGRFRMDLLHRLMGSVLEIPPLRQRREDIPELLAHFVPLFERSFNLRPITIPDESLRILVRHSWPGNVRQLKNFVSQAMEAFPDRVITPARTRGLLLRSVGIRQKSSGKRFTPKDLAAAVKAADGNVSEAARTQGISRRHMYRLLKATGLRPRVEGRSQAPTSQAIAGQV